MAQPDGRPLYAYKCSDSDYEQLRDKTRSQMPDAVRGRLGEGEESRFAATFCFYAAEAFHRRHEGGPWAWETVFAEIGHAPPSLPRIYEWVKTGLKLWQRPLLRSRNGDREFLVTLACEGGLPLLLLRRESASLSRYFRELLAACHRQRHTYDYDPKETARQIAARYLPASLRHDVVFQLSGDLIQSVITLQEQVDEAADPIASLDRLEPEWRKRLPLPLGDATVEILLRNLVGQASSLTLTERQRWRWRCFLVRKGDGWSVEQHLELPRTVTGASLQAWSDWTNLPPRLRVLLQTTEGKEVIALLTRLGGTGEQATYQCEGLRRNGVRLAGRAAEAGARLLLNQGSGEVELPMIGGQELGPLPWVFVERGGQWEICGEGSVRCREGWVRVLALDGGRCVADGDWCEFLGQAPALERSLYHITGPTEWRHPELGTVRIRCASQQESEKYFLLRGDRLPSVLNPVPPFLGMPGLYTVGQDDQLRAQTGGSLEWRPVDAPESDWRSDASACVGKVWIRYRDADDALRFRRQVEVVPPAADVGMVRVGARLDEAGIIRLSGLPAARVVVPERERCQFSVRPVDDGVEIDCFAQAGLPVAQFGADLQWPGGRSLTLALPFPRQGAAFVRADRMLPLMERVALDRLTGIEAVVRAPSRRERFYLKGRLRTHVPLQSGREFWEALPRVSESIQFALYDIQDRLASMLAMTGDLDAVVVLRVVDGMERPLAGLEVAQFDMALEPDPMRQCVVLPQDSLERLDADREEHITAKMVPLWAPSATPTDLVYDDAAGAWQIPDALQPGPWWVLGYDGDWARFRPLLWPVEGEDVGAEPSALIRAIREPDQNTRREKLRALVNALATEAEHPDWTRLPAYLRLARAYPAGSLDLFQHLIEEPEAMVMALLKSTDEEFDLVWSLAEQLPFSWYLVPVTKWLEAAGSHFGAVRAGLADYDPDGKLLLEVFEGFRRRVADRQVFFKSVCDWIGEHIFPGHSLPDSELAAIARSGGAIADVFIQGLEQEMQARHDAQERYPSGRGVMELTERPDFPEQFLFGHLIDHLRPMRCAPFVAAEIALKERGYSEALLFEFRQLRAFDSDWFDHAFAVALCRGLALRSAATEGARP